MAYHSLEKGGYIIHMNRIFVLKIALLLLLITGLAASLGCESLVRGGADVVLEGISVGSVSMEGKPITGLPSQKVNLKLKVATNEVRINTSSNKTTISLKPTDAVITITPEGTTFTGVKSEQFEIIWEGTQSSK
jgi:hypothetical protein